MVADRARKKRMDKRLGREFDSREIKHERLTRLQARKNLQIANLARRVLVLSERSYASKQT